MHGARSFHESCVSIEVERPTPHGAVLTAVGVLDIATTPELRTRLDEALADGPDALTVDLTDVTFIDSSGLRSLLGASRRADERSGQVVLRSPSPAVQRLLEITGTTTQFRVDEATA